MVSWNSKHDTLQIPTSFYSSIRKHSSIWISPVFKIFCSHFFGICIQNTFFSQIKSQLITFWNWSLCGKLKQTRNADTAPSCEKSTWKQGIATHPDDGVRSTHLHKRPGLKKEKVVDGASARLSTSFFLPAMPRISLDWLRCLPSLPKPPRVCAFLEKATTPGSAISLLD